MGVRARQTDFVLTSLNLDGFTGLKFPSAVFRVPKANVEINSSSKGYDWLALLKYQSYWLIESSLKFGKSSSSNDPDSVRNVLVPLLPNRKLASRELTNHRLSS